ncbi:GNAT family N-acetyltransferase [Pseudomonas sp. MM211]|uniref:GNAT family N-acetyltransferase n=1 Tax=Pseudomonas sp. MM211 TaxID=2866808 RepID=UPI001CECABA1|nr:GNAT family N-acetyltransferase [Pseudomonas sp. MM211]UCJ18234.1 GNAT family N-acetyltransferase [Pseudomonas sp. MM211]
MSIELVPASAEQLPLIRNLYQFYAYESSDWEQEDVEIDGRFYVHEPHLQRYWQDEGWSAQLILADGFIAGFLLLERYDDPSVAEMEFADLFVLRKYRRLGIGRAVLQQVVSDGRTWLTCCYEQDELASAFCKHVLSELPLNVNELSSTEAEPGLRRFVLHP